MSGLLTYFGDDFTGSTDVLLQYHRFALDGVLFLGPPEADELRRCARSHDVIGVAGMTRSMRTAEITAEITPVFHALAALRPALVQYKVCSTADSSPDIGSFAPAVGIGRELFGRRPVPLLAAQPDLQRYTVFGHHFAAHRGAVHRLDRQAPMAEHPVTPMRESDLRLHLAAQVAGTVGGIDVLELTDLATAEAAYRRAAQRGDEVVVLDALDDGHLRVAADLVAATGGDGVAFALGSGGLSAGFGARHPAGRRQPGRPTPSVRGPYLVLSGSCSPVTGQQIEWALAHGWHGVRLDPAALAAGGPAADAEVREACLDAARGLSTAPGAVVHTSLGGVDEVARGGTVDVTTLGGALAAVFRHCRRVAGVKRVVVAGGDTSGQVMTALGARSLEAVAPAGGSALLCRVHDGPRELRGVEVVLKGGQIGGESFFGEVFAPSALGTAG
ncbi:four-carbon acid sugar kinase family protein [Pseudonocardia sichuanensis]